MNKTLSPNELATIGSAFPVIDIMTRREKLNRWSRLVRQHDTRIQLLHELEYMDIYQLRRTGMANTIFDIAANDPVFQQAGLASNDAAASVKFFEISRENLHHISCDCLGQLSNEQMADRIDRM